jgi:hypothetical protein
VLVFVLPASVRAVVLEVFVVAPHPAAAIPTVIISASRLRIARRP